MDPEESSRTRVCRNMRAEDNEKYSLSYEDSLQKMITRQLGFDDDVTSPR
jgi:hypothetical protein